MTRNFRPLPLLPLLLLLPSPAWGEDPRERLAREYGFEAWEVSDSLYQGFPFEEFHHPSLELSDTTFAPEEGATHLRYRMAGSSNTPSLLVTLAVLHDSASSCRLLLDFLGSFQSKLLPSKGPAGDLSFHAGDPENPSAVGFVRGNIFVSIKSIRTPESTPPPILSLAALLDEAIRRYPLKGARLPGPRIRGPIVKGDLCLHRGYTLPLPLDSEERVVKVLPFLSGGHVRVEGGELLLRGWKEGVRTLKVVLINRFLMHTLYQEEISFIPCNGRSGKGE